MVVINCEFCGEPVDTKANGSYRRVLGWVQNRAGGGAHAVALPSQPLGWAHYSCLQVEKSGAVARNSPQLF